MAIVIGKDGKAREYQAPRAAAPAPRTMERPFIPNVQPGMPIPFRLGGNVPELSMGMASDGPAVYLGDDRMMDPSDMHQKMLRAGYGREEIMDSASMLQDKAQHIVDDLDKYAGGARSGFDHDHEFAQGGAVPRQTTIAGQPHYLAYINPEEGEVLKGLGGAEAPGPGGIPSYFLHTSEARGRIAEAVDRALGTNFSGNNPPDGGSDSDTTSPGTSNDTSSPGTSNDTTSPNTNTTDTDDDTSSTIGQVSSTGQYAGDGFEWVRNEGGYLTRTYTGAGRDNNLGTDVIQGGTATAPLKETIAQISLDQVNKPETVFGESPGSATDGSLLDLFRSEENRVGSGSYAEQIANQQQAAANQNQPVTTVEDQESTTDPVTGETTAESSTGGMFGYGYDYDGKDGITFGEIIRDMTDGGGPGGPSKNPLNPVYKDAAGNELGQGFGRRLIGGIGRDLTMGLTAGIFTPLDQQAQKLIDAGYSKDVAEDYVKRTRDTMEENQLQQQLEQQRRSNDDGPAKPPTDPCPKGYIMDPQKGVCVIDPSAGADDDDDDDYGYQPPAYTPPPLSPYLDVGDTGGGFTLQPGSEDVSFMRRSGQYAGGGQVGLGSMNPFMGMYKFR